MTRIIIKISVCIIACFTSLGVYSQRLEQDGVDFRIKYLDEEIWQQGLELGSKLNLDSLIDIYENPFFVNEFNNKVVVIKFWFVGCRGCKQEEDYIRQVTEHFSKSPNIKFVSISMTNQSKIIKYYQKNGDFGYRTISMKRQDIENRFMVRTSPTHWFFKNGKLVDKIIGPIYSQDAKNWMIKYLEELQE